MYSSREKALLLSVKDLITTLVNSAELAQEIDHPKWAKKNLKEIATGLNIAMVALNELETLYQKNNTKLPKMCKLYKLPEV